MKKLIFMSVVMSLALVLGGNAYGQRKKIGMKRAQAIAVSHAKGLRLKAKELEHENGKWIYSFEFVNRNKSIREINVDAYTGRIVGIEHEDVKKEATEERNEKKMKN